MSIKMTHCSHSVKGCRHAPSAVGCDGFSGSVIAGDAEMRRVLTDAAQRFYAADRHCPRSAPG
jgi:hypothetical protein